MNESMITDPAAVKALPALSAAAFDDTRSSLATIESMLLPSANQLAGWSCDVCKMAGRGHWLVQFHAPNELRGTAELTARARSIARSLGGRWDRDQKGDGTVSYDGHIFKDGADLHVVLHSVETLARDPLNLNEPAEVAV